MTNSTTNEARHGSTMLTEQGYKNRSALKQTTFTHIVLGTATLASNKNVSHFSFHPVIGCAKTSSRLVATLNPT